MQVPFNPGPGPRVFPFASLVDALTALPSTGGVLELLPGVYDISTAFTISQSNIVIRGYGATLRFTGANTDRLMTITGGQVKFIGVSFSANNAQPFGSLIYIDDNTDAPTFIDCTFKDMSVTSHGSLMKHQVYAVTISPYGVTNFRFSNCTFSNLTSDNTAGVQGAGFVGAVFFMKYTGAPQTFDSLATVPATLTSGVIDRCVFDRITTTLAKGLTDNEAVTYDDGDAIRALSGTGMTRIDLQVVNCRFTNVSKRAVKFSGVGGLSIDNCDVIADQGAYRMAAAIRVAHKTQVRGLRVFSGAGSMSPLHCINLESQSDVMLDNIWIQACAYAIVFQDSVTTAVENVSISNLIADNVVSGGIKSSIAGVDSVFAIRLSNVVIRCIGDHSLGLELPSSRAGAGESRLCNVEVVNGDVKIPGDNVMIDGLILTINRPGYTGSSSARMLLEFGATGGSGVYAIARNVLINVTAISDSYLSVARPYLFAILGNGTIVENMVVRVPDTLSTSYSHGHISGANQVVDGVTYSGPGRIAFGDTVPSDGSVYRNLSRQGQGSMA